MSLPYLKFLILRFLVRLRGSCERGLRVQTGIPAKVLNEGITRWTTGYPGGTPGYAEVASGYIGVPRGGPGYPGCLFPKVPYCNPNKPGVVVCKAFSPNTVPL